MRRNYKSSLLVIALFMILFFLLTISSYAANTLRVTDSSGRIVNAPAGASRIICIGSGCLRLICYLGAQDRIVGIESFEKTHQVGRSYRYAYPELLSLPIIAAGGPGNINKEPDLEAVLKVKPDIIFACYMDADRADTLQKKIGIPVITLSYGWFGSFGNELYTSLRLLGKILDKEKRSEEIIAFTEKSKADLLKRTSGIDEASKPSVYIGGVGYRGAQGIESTETDYLPFEWIKAKNIAKGVGREGHLFINKEKILALNPDVIFLDALGLSIISTDYAKHPQFYQALNAFSKGQVYTLWPFNAYMTNIDTVIIDAYAAGSILYPEKFRDIDMNKKIDEVYSFFIGKSISEQMKKDGGVLGARWKP